MNKKGGLGKGLDALIQSNDSIDDDKQINKIDINLIRANDEQPRKHFDGEKISHLAESIKEHGIIQPIILKKDGNNYFIVAGERRWRAAKLIGLKEIPAVVLELTDKEVLEVSLIENIQREDLNPIEEALAYKRLIEEYNLTQEQLGNKLGKSRVAITNSIRLLQLDKRVQLYLVEGVISEGHGRTILAIQDMDVQYELAQKVIDEGLTVRQLESIIKKYGEVKNEKANEDTNKSLMNPYLSDIKFKLENHFGTKVLLSNTKNNKGKIEIEYYSQDDLNRILEILNI